jgi:4-hydroxybenzoate polyprenyltransferase
MARSVHMLSQPPARRASMASLVTAVVKLVRPKQWIKNLFVFAPLIFAKELFDPLHGFLALKAFIGFCLAASAIYVVNDIADVDADRAHPIKKHRPLAAGTISFPSAYFIAGFLLVVTALVVLHMDRTFQLLLGFYVLINVAYSVRLKEIVLLDVFIIAAGFMIRVIGGAYAIRVDVSTWLVLCTLFISLFLGFAKRRSELVQIPGSDFSERKVLGRYRISFLDQMLTIAGAAAVLSYALYTVAPRTIEIFKTDKLIYTTVFVIYGVFRYLYLIHTTTKADKPTDVVLSDVPLLLTTLLWAGTCVLLIYFSG